MWQGILSILIFIGKLIFPIPMIIAGINMLGEELSETNISKNFFSSVFNAVNDLIFILSPEGVIKDINKSVLKAFNCSTSIVNGEFLSDFLNIEDALSEKIKNRLSKNNKPYSKELLISMKEGSDIIGLVTYSNIVNRFGEFEGYLVNIKDIIRCKSDNNYTTFYFVDKSKVLVSKTLKYYSDILKEVNFLRVHQSHLVNKDFIKEFIKSDGGYLILNDSSNIPVSARKRKEILLSLKK